MTKISIVLALCFYSIAGMAQSLDDINKLLEKKQYREAKTAIDNHMADVKNNSKSDGWYFKGRVYNSLSNEKTTPAEEAFDLKMQAFEAFKKTQEMDNRDIRMKVENYVSYLNLYYGFYDIGAGLYNESNYEKAFNAFKNALIVEDYILNKNYTYDQTSLNALDTSLVLNTAIAAMQAKNRDAAAVYYKKLTDANVAGDNYVEVYEFLADYYSKKEDDANLKDIIAKGKLHYPKNEYWTSLELDELRKKGDQAVLFAKYEELMQTSPTIFVIPYNYAIELFNSVYGRDAKAADPKATKEKLTKVLNTAISIDKGHDALVLLTKHLYNLSSDLSIAANLEKDAKKKAELVALTHKQMDEFLDQSNKASAAFEADGELKPVQRATYLELLTNMLEIYNYKKDTKKAAEIEKKKAAL